MDKKEVAELLNISTRLVEKYASEGRLGEVKYVRGKTSKRAEYSPEAVENLKTVLESPDTALTASKPDARLFVADLVEAMVKRDEHRSASVRTSEKLLLNLNDCRLLTGLSDANLRDAIKAGSLKAKIIGRGYKIKRTDLDKFVSGL
jgi:excisionase family DNA binding protein